MVCLSILCSNVVVSKNPREPPLNGRGKFRNLMIIGPANCEKTFMFKPLESIYVVFSNLEACQRQMWMGQRWLCRGHCFARFPMEPWHDCLQWLVTFIRRGNCEVASAKEPVFFWHRYRERYTNLRNKHVPNSLRGQVQCIRRARNWNDGNQMQCDWIQTSNSGK